MDDAKIDEIINQHQGDPSAMLKVMVDIQRENHWLPSEVLRKISTELDVPMSKVQHAATFFKSLKINHEALHELELCDGTGCHVRGASRVVGRVEEILGIKAGETDPTLNYNLKTVVCMGRCASGPLMVVDGKQYSKIDPAKAEDALKGY